MKKNYGSALVDYIVPTALIGLVVGVSLYYLISDGKLLNFLGASANMEVNSTDQMGVIGYRKNDPNSALNKLAGGSLGGTPDNPVKQCNNGKCAIDYGEFMLTGIPENFGEFISTTGTSGGTDQLISLMQQIAEQLKENGDMSGYKDYMDLANLGHFIADIQKTNESHLTNCGGSGYDANLCYYNLQNNAANISLPSELASILTNYDPNESLWVTTEYSNIGPARSEMKNNLDSKPFEDPTVSPAAAFITLFDKIMADDKYSNQMRGVTKELYLNVADLGTFHKSTNCVSNQFMSSLTTEYDDPASQYDSFELGIPVPIIDPLTGDTTGETYYQGNSAAIGSLLHPPASIGTDVNSALICAAGWNKDTGSNCHQ